MLDTTHEPGRLAYPIDEFGKQNGIPRTTLYGLIAAGKLRTFKIGRRRYVSTEAGREFIEQMERSA